MQLQHPLRTVTSTVDADVLAILARAEHEFTVSTLVRMISERSADGVRRTLARLTEQGIVTRRVAGRTHTFSLNREHLAAPALVELASLRQTFLERTRANIAGWEEPPLYAALFGSAARGDMRPSSDIDIALIRQGEATPRWHAQTDGLLSDIPRWTGNDARALEFAADEIEGTGARESVLADILRDGIALYGDPATLRRLIRAR